MQIALENKMHLKPDFNFSIGYSKSNIGDEVYYIDPAQADPLPRMDRLGYGISTGFDLLKNNFKMNILNLSLTAEADDILISAAPHGKWQLYLQLGLSINFKRY